MVVRLRFKPTGLLFSWDTIAKTRSKISLYCSISGGFCKTALKRVLRSVQNLPNDRIRLLSDKDRAWLSTLIYNLQSKLSPYPEFNRKLILLLFVNLDIRRLQAFNTNVDFLMI